MMELWIAMQGTNRKVTLFLLLLFIATGRQQFAIFFVCVRVCCYDAALALGDIQGLHSFFLFVRHVGKKLLSANPAFQLPLVPALDTQTAAL